MKKTTLIFILACLWQINLFSQTNNHPTIDTVEVSYMGAANDQVLPEAIIHMKTWSGVSRIYCKIIDPDNNSVAYSVSYNTADMPVIAAGGSILCMKNNSITQILGTTALVLKTYTYQVQTEDAQGNISAVYSITRALEP
ncbi:MAG: hypothetical protein JST26_11695 [Bacteroidetes bacterium]|nr:hypothetical protein [Bacteroidota bacterium]